MKNKNLAFTDTETTGLDYRHSEIISIALIVRNPEKQILHKKLWHIHPRWPEKANPKSLEINGYTYESWEKRGVTTHQKALVEYVELTKGCLFVAHNTFFDKIMLLEEMYRQDLSWPMNYHSIDTSTLAWNPCVKGVLPGIGLKDVCDGYHLSNHGSHDAMVDVERMIKVYDIFTT